MDENYLQKKEKLKELFSQGLTILQVARHPEIMEKHSKTSQWRLRLKKEGFIFPDKK